MDASVVKFGPRNKVIYVAFLGNSISNYWIAFHWISMKSEDLNIEGQFLGFLACRSIALFLPNSEIFLYEVQVREDVGGS